MLRHEQFDGGVELFQSKLCSKIFPKRVSIAVDNDHSRRESISLKHSGTVFRAIQNNRLK